MARRPLCALKLKMPTPTRANAGFRLYERLENLYWLAASERHSRQSSLNLLLEGSGTVDIDLVSLYPKDTWQNRPNGLRNDLVKLLKEMKPGFLRFPAAASSKAELWTSVTSGRQLSAT
jgi:hypothetical protein